MTEPTSPTSEPDRQEVEVFARDTNAWVVRTPGRSFPGLVVQGDALHALLVRADAVLERARTHHDAELESAASSLRDQLRGMTLRYVAALDEHGTRLPFSTGPEIHRP